MTFNSDEIKPVAIAVIELRLSEGISYASQSVSRIFFNFLTLVVGCRVDLKTFFARLCMTNTAEVSQSKHQDGFGVIFCGKNYHLYS